MYYIPQLQTSDCGLACLKMMLATLNKDKNYLYLPQDEKHQSYSYDELTKISKKYGLELQGFKVDDKAEILHNDKYPLIVSLARGENTYHSVIVEKIKFKRVKIVDPNSGVYWLKLDKFYDEWTGLGLIMTNFVETNCPIERKNPIKTSDMVVNIIAQVLGAVAVYFGVFFLDNKTKPIIPTLFFIVFVLMELFIRINLIRIMDKMDKEVITPSLEKPKQGFMTFFKRYEAYKKSVLTSPLNQVIQLIMIVLIIGMILWNNPRNFLLVISSIAFGFIEYFIVMPYVRKSDAEISKLESEISSIKTAEDFQIAVRGIHYKSYKVAKDTLVVRYLRFAIMLTLSILLVKFNKSILLPYVIFYFALQLFLYDAFKKTISYVSGERETLKTKALFYNCYEEGGNNNLDQK